MSIRQLSLTHFRNLRSETLDFHPAINVIFGDNGSGKTSLLEAIYISAQTVSFRQPYLKKCIRHGERQFLLFARYDEHKTGISKSDRKLEIRLNGENLKRRSDAVRLTPIKIFNSDSFGLITGAPEIRRQYLDWILFHVEQTYTENWIAFRHALKQRNRLLKDRRDLHLLDYWDEALLVPSEKLSRLRQDYCALISDSIATFFGPFLSAAGITLEYQAGWDSQAGLSASLKKSREKDIRGGYTAQGIHRDNVLIQSAGRPAVDVLSRGQVKRLALVLLLAALKIVSSQRKHAVILLIDDLQSEIDKSTEKVILEKIVEMDLQVFITNIEEAFAAGLKGKDFKMFHVEHGTIRPHKVS